MILSIISLTVNAHTQHNHHNRHHHHNYHHHHHHHHKRLNLPEPLALDFPVSLHTHYVIMLALHAYECARRKGLTHKPILSIIDYSVPSCFKELWVLDLHRHRVLYHTYVTHGEYSGDLIASKFSNRSGSHKSSLGVFLTGKAFIGRPDGYSLRLIGLEPKFNGNAYRRDIVMHGAKYANPSFISRNGMLGVSFGCPAVEKKMAKPIISKIKDGTILFVYYPNKNWLKHSHYLHCKIR